MQKHSNPLLLSLLVLSLLQGAASASFQHAHDNELDALMELDIESLTVSVASKREETVDEAPAVLNVVTKEEISYSGARNLFELLDRQPAIHSHYSQAGAESSINIRGNNGIVLNNHTLILLNGRPLRESYTGGGDQNILKTFPLSSVERLEIVRGPGSVLYGTNAFAGVVNVVTQEAENEFEGRAAVSYGSFNTRRTDMSFGSAGERYNIYGALSAEKTDGWKNRFTDSLGNTGSDKSESSFTSGFFSANIDSFTLNYNESYNRYDQTGFPVIFPFKKSWKRQRFVDVGYDYDMSDNWQVSLNGSYTNTRSNYIGISESDADDWLAELSVKGKLAANTNVILGG